MSFVYPNPMPTKAHTVSNSKHYDWSAFYPDEVHAWKTAQAAVEHLRTFGHTREPFGVWPRERIIGLGAYDGEAWLRRQLEGLGKDPE